MQGGGLFKVSFQEKWTTLILILPGVHQVSYYNINIHLQGEVLKQWDLDHMHVAPS